MRLAVSWILAALMALPASAGAQSAPLQEIRRILLRDALVPRPRLNCRVWTRQGCPNSLRALIRMRAISRPGNTSLPCPGARPGSASARNWSSAMARFTSVYRGGAADMAGIPDRSRLLEVDGRSVVGLDAQAVASLLRGEEDTVARLALARPGGERLDVGVVREPFKPLDVEPVPPGDRQILRIREFVAGMTRPALQATIDFLARKGAAKDGPLIIDLRDATGGDLYEAFDMAGMFLPAGTLLGTIQGRGEEVREVRASSGEKYLMPLALIVGPDTASSAEIFAGALHQQGRATLVGQRTFGKCSSQTDTRLSDGSVLRYTNRDVLLPGGGPVRELGLCRTGKSWTRSFWIWRRWLGWWRNFSNKLGQFHLFLSCLVDKALFRGRTLTTPADRNLDEVMRRRR